MTKHWALQDAKARLSELVRAAEKEPQHITVRGEPAAVVVSAAAYGRLKGEKKNASGKSMTLLEALRACPRDPDFRIERIQGKARKFDP